MPINDTTTNRAYQKPNVANALADDVGRLRSALDAIDTDVNTCLAAVADGAITDQKVSASAEIAVSKLADGLARQLLQTDAAGTGVEWTSNVEIPGTLGIQLGSVSAPSLYFASDTNTGIYSPGANEFAIAIDGTARLSMAAAGQGYYTFNSTSLGVGGFTYRSGTTNESFLTFGVSTTLGRVFLTSSANGSGTNLPLAFGTGSGPTEVCRATVESELLVGYTSRNGTAGQYKLQCNSQIFATSATIATSDARYKTNIESLQGGYDMIQALRPVAFDWIPQDDIVAKDGTLIREGHAFPIGRQIGFIAQEVQTALSDHPWINNLIKENSRPEILDGQGNVLAPDEPFLGIAEGNLIAVLTSALQEAIGEIEALKLRVTTLESA